MTGSLESEIARLIAAFGKDAVAKTAQRLTQPQKRKQLEIADFTLLYPVLQREAHKWLAGHKKTPHTVIAKSFWLEHGGTSEEAVQRRIMERLASKERRFRQAFFAIDISLTEYPHDIHVRACIEGRNIPNMERFAQMHLNDVVSCFVDLKAYGENIDPSETVAQLKHRISALKNSRPVNTLRGLMQLGRQG